MLVVSEAGQVTYANDAGLVVLGLYDERPTVGRQLLDLVDRDSRRRAFALFRQVTGGSPGGPVYLRLNGDPVRWVAVRGAPYEGGMQLALVEVTHAVLAREQLLRSEQRFRVAFDASPTGMALVEPGGVFVRVNAALAEMVGRDPEWFVGRTSDDVTLPEDLPVNERLVGEIGSTGSARSHKRYLRADGTTRYGELTAVRVTGDEGEALTLVQIEDVTERRLAEGRLRRMALHDALTDLPGRPLVLDRLRQALEVRDHRLVAVLFVDLDGFKLVNDALGHAAGDAVLVQTGQRLREVVRRGDTVGRFGGDEFLVVCPGLEDREEALEVAARVERALGVPYPHAGDEVLVSASVGVAFAGERADADDLVADADTAMYRAKELGKRRYEVFDSAMRERASERARVERLVQRVADEGSVVVHYQPVVDTATRQVVGVEALMRVCEDDGTLLEPDDFLAVALRRRRAPRPRRVSCSPRPRRRSPAGGAELGADLDLAVNVCARLATVRRCRRRRAGARRRRAAGGAAGARRLTEQDLVGGAPPLLDALVDLRARGVRLALDASAPAGRR